MSGGVVFVADFEFERLCAIERTARAFLVAADEAAFTIDDSFENIDRYQAAAAALRQALAATVGGTDQPPSGGATPAAGK